MYLSLPLVKIPPIRLRHAACWVHFGAWWRFSHPSEGSISESISSSFPRNDIIDLAIQELIANNSFPTGVFYHLFLGDLDIDAGAQNHKLLFYRHVSARVSVENSHVVGLTNQRPVFYHVNNSWYLNPVLAGFRTNNTFNMNNMWSSKITRWNDFFVGIVSGSRTKHSLFVSTYFLYSI